VVRAFSFQKVPKCDWHGPRSHINHVLPIKTADQVPAEVVQIGVDDDGNPRPFFVVPKNLTVANYGDLLAGLRIDNIAVEHVFLVCGFAVTFTTPHSARCSGCSAIVRGCLGMARVPHPAFESRRSPSRPKGHKTAMARSGRFGSRPNPEPRNKHTGAPLSFRRAPSLPSPRRLLGPAR
jgi:hypothetical protein